MLEKSADLIEIKKSKFACTKYSIVIPTYKRTSTLANTINSALCQKYCGDYTIIVVDNSPERKDDTELFMEQITDPRIAYFKNEINVGMINNWNQCILASNSEWVVIVHDDDLLDENCLINVDNTIANNPGIDAVLPNFDQKNNPYIKESNNFRIKNDNVFKRIARRLIRKDIPITANLFCDNIYGPPTCGLALRKKAVCEFGGFPDRCIAADWDFMMQFSKNHKVLRCDNKTGTYLWAINASMNETTMEQMRKDRITIIKDIVKQSNTGRFYYWLLKRDFDKKFAARITDHVDYSIVYKCLEKYYRQRI